jgi:hypothetical protein
VSESVPSGGDFIVYGLCEPDTGLLRYIGKTANGMRRIRLHFSPSKLKRDGRTRKANWIRSLLAKGLKPKVVILEEFESESPLNEQEIFYISYFRFLGCDLTNLTVGGDGAKGYCPPPELRAYLSECAKRQHVENPDLKFRLGKLAKKRWEDLAYRHRMTEISKSQKHSEETKRRIGDAGRGRIISLEQRKRISEARKGRNLSPEHRAKISASRKGQKLSEEHKKKISSSLLASSRKTA